MNNDKHTQNKKVTREFGISSFAVSNRTSVFILAFIIVIFGLISYIGMPKEQYPEIVMPTIYVNTIYPGNSPTDIENLITRPIEKELKPIKGIKKITSTSAQDVSAIIVEFNEDVKIDEALTDVKDAIDKSKGDLPSDLDNDPTAAELDFSEIPLLFINLSGDFEVSKLKEYAEYLEEKIEALQGVSKVEVTGALDREIQINADPFKMEAVKVGFNDIEQAIGAENLNVGGGDVLIGGYRRALRVSGEFTSVQQIKNIIIKSENQRPIYLKDVADVVDSYVERQSYARHAGSDFLETGTQPTITLIVKKRSGGNIIDTSELINEALDDAKTHHLPKNLALTISNDQSENIQRELSNLENSIISGVILVVAVLLFFLGLRNALLVGISIPFSMFMSFMVLNALGITMNIVVLFALILALGMLVDNAIVVVENIYRLREEGLSKLQAAKEGVGEVALPIIGSTMTTLAAFVPLAFWGGLMGEFMKYLPMTLIIVLASSLFVGLIINPVLAARFMKVDYPKEDEPRRRKQAFLIGGAMLIGAVLSYLLFDTYTVGNLLMLLGLISIGNIVILKPAVNWFQNVLLVRLEKAYMVLLRFALQGVKPYIFLVGTFFLLIFSIALVVMRQPQVILFPGNDPLYMFVNIEFPLGTDVEVTNEKTKNLEEQVFKILTPYKDIVRSIVTNVGAGTGGDAARGEGGHQVTPHKSRMTIEFVPFQYRNGINTAHVMKEIGEKIEKKPGMKITVEKNNDGPPTGKPINIEIIGDDYVTILQEVERMKAHIEKQQIGGVEQLEIEAEIGKPEMLLKIDREKARKYGLSTGMIASSMRTALFGKEVSKFKDGDDDYPIQLRFKDKYRYDVSTLMNQRMTFMDKRGRMHQIPISAVAKLNYNSSFGFIKRKDLDRMVVLSSNIIEGYNPNQVVEQVKIALSSFKLKEGYAYKFTGEQEEQQESMAFLARALLIAVSAIFLILVSQFNSFSKPFVILTSVLLSTIGVFLGLAIFNMDFVIVMTGIGIISLAGVVVNNAIVLIDYTELTRKRRKQELGIDEEGHLPISEFIECLVQAGYTRMRPVLLTAITTVLGLIPLAVGLNIDFAGLFARFDPNIYVGGDSAVMWGPMAWTVIFGLVFATFLTLVIVPVMCLIIDKFKQFIRPNNKKVTTIIPKERI